MRAVLTPASFGWVCLQLTYDGRHPPTALLDEIAGLGWAVPAPPSRPASAIDWNTPDPSTGQTFTVRPWEAVHDIDPPGRFRTRASWTQELRTRALSSLAGVFAAYQVEVTSPEPQLAALAGREAAADPGGRPAAGDGGAVADPAASGAAIVGFTAPVERLGAIRSLLDDTGLAFHLQTGTRPVRQTYRGSAFEHQMPVLEGEVAVRADLADEVRERLRDEHVRAVVRPATRDDVRRVSSLSARRH